jgi:tRNA (cytidine/uridine-2'-O-)-methyltransferase
MTKIVLFQPDIAGNVGTIIRTCVCFDVELHIIEPCGFPFDMQRVKKFALDYIFKAKIFRHNSFDDFFDSEIKQKNQRLILASTKGSTDYREFNFSQNDVIMFGRESAGVPEKVFAKADERVFIPMQNDMRSLNVAISCGIILAKALESSPVIPVKSGIYSRLS